MSANGLLYCALFSKLEQSPRNSSPVRAVILKRLAKAVSICHSTGPRNALRPKSPQAPVAGTAKAESNLRRESAKCQERTFTTMPAGLQRPEPRELRYAAELHRRPALLAASFRPRRPGKSSSRCDIASESRRPAAILSPVCRAPGTDRRATGWRPHYWGSARLWHPIPDSFGSGAPRCRSAWRR